MTDLFESVNKNIRVSNMLPFILEILRRRIIKNIRVYSRVSLYATMQLSIESSETFVRYYPFDGIKVIHNALLP